MRYIIYMRCIWSYWWKMVKDGESSKWFGFCKLTRLYFTGKEGSKNKHAEMKWNCFFIVYEFVHSRQPSPYSFNISANYPVDNWTSLVVSWLSHTQNAEPGCIYREVTRPQHHKVANLDLLLCLDACIACVLGPPLCGLSWSRFTC